MLYQFSKSEKKIARACIDKALDLEFQEGLERSEAVILDWRAGKFSTSKEAYHKLFQTLHQKDKAISQRYDGLTGGRWLLTIVGLLHDGYISEEDITGFSEETMAIIAREINDARD